MPEVDKEKCDHCGKCAEVLACKAIAVWGKQVMIFGQLCHGCGACSYKYSAKKKLLRFVSKGLCEQLGPEQNRKEWIDEHES